VRLPAPNRDCKGADVVRLPSRDREGAESGKENSRYRTFEESRRTEFSGQNNLVARRLLYAKPVLCI
jgi:hypothetical protein